MESAGKVENLVLDAGPLITNGYSTLSGLGDKFYTTPSVYDEIRDERARQNLLLWGDNLAVRQPSTAYLKIVSDFAKKTGDYAVLSVTDLQILALTYELEVENNGGSNLRTAPRQSKTNGPRPAAGAANASDKLAQPTAGAATSIEQDVSRLSLAPESREPETVASGEPTRDAAGDSNPSVDADDDGWSTVSRKEKASAGKKKKEKYRRVKEERTRPSEDDKLAIPDLEPAGLEHTGVPSAVNVDSSVLTAETAAEQLDVVDEDEDEDEAGWITPENLENQQILDSSLEVPSQNNNAQGQSKITRVGMASGDFAMQNVAMQIGLNVINPHSGRQIQKIRSWMLRCHACFFLTAPPAGSVPRQFCPRCGGATLLRCTVTTSASTGQLQVHLKKNFQWTHRGDRYSLPNPQAKKTRKTGGEVADTVLLREDQKEYLKAVKNDVWRKRHNEKMLDEWIGGGGIDALGSPFASGSYKREVSKTGVKVGKGRYVNERRRKA